MKQHLCYWYSISAGSSFAWTASVVSTSSFAFPLAWFGVARVFWFLADSQCSFNVVYHLPDSLILGHHQRRDGSCNQNNSVQFAGGQVYWQVNKSWPSIENTNSSDRVQSLISWQSAIVRSGQITGWQWTVFDIQRPPTRVGDIKAGSCQRLLQRWYQR